MGGLLFLLLNSWLVFFGRVADLAKVYALVFLGGMVVDLLAGWNLGWTGFFLVGEMLVITVSARAFRLRIRVKLALLVVFSLTYFYVSRRYFF